MGLYKIGLPLFLWSLLFFNYFRYLPHTDQWRIVWKPPETDRGGFRQVCSKKHKSLVIPDLLPETSAASFRRFLDNPSLTDHTVSILSFWNFRNLATSFFENSLPKSKLWRIVAHFTINQHFLLYSALPILFILIILKFTIEFQGTSYKCLAKAKK